SMGSDRGSTSTSLRQFAYYDRDSSSWRTSRPSGRGGSGKSSPTWPRSGMTSGGRAFELPKWEPPITATGGSESPTLPTPTARDWRSGASNLHGRNSRPLNEVILLLKTPTAQLGRNGAAQHPEKRKRGGHGPTLDDEVSFLLPHAD